MNESSTQSVDIKPNLAPYILDEAGECISPHNTEIRIDSTAWQVFLLFIISLQRFLSPATNYAVRVRGFTVDVGPFSEAINVTTREDRELWFSYYRPLATVIHAAAQVGPAFSFLLPSRLAVVLFSIYLSGSGITRNVKDELWRIFLDGYYVWLVTRGFDFVDFLKECLPLWIGAILRILLIGLTQDVVCCRRILSNF